MHKASMLRMQYFVETYLIDSTYKSILDVGSYDVNGSYRELFDVTKFHYTGLDMAAGPNVDIVPKKAYSWTELSNDSYDVIISGQAFEHIEFFWVTMAEMARVLRPGGLMCIIVPRDLALHRYPLDCYRFDADGMIALARYSNLVPLHASTHLAPKNAPPVWYTDADSVLIAKKPMDWKGMIDFKEYDFVETDIEVLTTGFISENQQEYYVDKNSEEYIRSTTPSHSFFKRIGRSIRKRVKKIF